LRACMCCRHTWGLALSPRGPARKGNLPVCCCMSGSLRLQDKTSSSHHEMEGAQEAQHWPDALKKETHQTVTVSQKEGDEDETEG
jgi:hypothetical protein